MSRLSRILSISILELKYTTGIMKYLIRFYAHVTSLWDEYPGQLYYNLKNYFHNLRWMHKHIWEFREFDYSYSLNLYIESLENLARGLKRYNNLVHSEKNYRRCITAANMLKKAYSYEAWNDRSYKNHISRCRHKWLPYKRDLVQLVTEHPCDNAMNMDKELYDKKMYDIIAKRQKKEEATLKQDAWNYLHKYIEHFWD